ncbi:hypothetical protein POD33_00135, partial [Streptomyces moderatus]
TSDTTLETLGVNPMTSQRARPTQVTRSWTQSAAVLLGCPFHGNSQWRNIRDTSPDEWQDVVEFDAAIRQGNARANANGNHLLGQAFLHRSRMPLSEAPIDHITAAEWAARQAELADAPDERELEQGVVDGCSPWACRGSEPAVSQEDFGLAS